MIVPLVACIVALALYPGFILERSEDAVQQSLAAPEELADQVSFEAPHIDYAGLSPVIALTAGMVVVLLAGLIGGRRQRFVVAGLAVIALATTAGLLIWQWAEPPQDLVAGALVIDKLSIAISLIAVRAAAFVVPLTLREPAAEDRHGDFQALLLCSVLGMVTARPGAEPDHAVRRDRAAVDPAVRAVRVGTEPRRVARVRAQVPDRRLDRLGDAAVRARVHLRRLGLDRLHRDPRRASRAACSTTR